VARCSNHERSRPQAQVDTGRLLVDPAVSHHPQLCCRPGDIVDAAANLKGGVPCARTGKAWCPCKTTRAIRHDIGHACTTCTDPKAHGHQEDPGHKAEGFLRTGTHAKTPPRAKKSQGNCRLSQDLAASTTLSSSTLTTGYEHTVAQEGMG